jgi:hypothetical protein
MVALNVGSRLACSRHEKKLAEKCTLETTDCYPEYISKLFLLRIYNYNASFVVDERVPEIRKKSAEKRTW